MWALLTQFFVAPTFLLGLSAAAIPVVLHLRYRTKAVEILFPSVKLLQLSTRRMAHRKKIEELLLLITRVLLLACLALALAKPFLSSAGPLASRARTALAIVVDNSGSMATRVGGQRRMDLARARADDILSGFGGEVTAGVFLAAGADEAQPGQTLTSKLDDVRAALGKVEPSPRHTELAAALARGLEAVANSGEPHRELYLLTDMQAYGLREALDLLKTRARVPHLSAAIVPIAPGTARDRAVVNLEAGGRALLAHMPLTFEATLKNLSGEPAEVQAELFLEGTRHAARRAKIGGGASATVSFPAVRFESPGLKTVAVQVEEDDNALNDRRVLALPLEDAVRVLVLEGTQSALDFQNASYYVARALDPFGAETGGASSGVRPIRMPDSALLSEDLARYKAVFLLNPGALSLEALRRLNEYVRQGGGLVIFPGEATDGPRLTQDLGLSVPVKGAGGEGLLPARLGKRFGRLETVNARPESQAEEKKEAPEARVAAIVTAHPVLAPFRGLDREMFTSIQVHAGFELAVPAGSSAVMLMILDNRDPFLVGGLAGAGEVYVFAAAPTPAWTNLPVSKGSVFLPLLHALCHHLAGRRIQAESRIVGRYDLRPPGQRLQAATLTAPDGKTTPLLEGADAGDQPLWADLDRVGVWRAKLVPVTEPGRTPPPEEETIHAFSVNADAGEASAEQLAPAEVREALEMVAEQAFLAGDPQVLSGVLKRIREGVPLWNSFLILVLMLAVLEVYLGSRVKAAGRAEEPPAQGEAGAQG